MSLFSFDSVFLNGSYVDIVVSYWNCIINFLTDKATNINENNKVFTSVTESLLFDDFQWKIFTTFLAIFIINIVIIYISWQIYGKRICNRFMKPATPNALEELKASVSRLKLPKEHSPRV